MTETSIAVILLLLLCGVLLLVAWIDLQRQIIPDALNAAIGALGALRVAISGGVQLLVEAALQAIVVAAAVWLLRKLYVLLRKQQGLGLGDVKLLAASTLCIGLAGIPAQLLTASLTALAAAAVLHVTGNRMTGKSALPFGPFLALGLLATIGLQESGWLA